MPLTKKQLKQIEEIIKRRFLAFTYDAVGERSLTSAEISRLHSAGIISERVRDFSGDPYTLGKIVALVEAEGVRAITYDNVLKIASKMTPLTGVEQKAIEYASEHAGQYMRGLMDDMVKDTTALTARFKGAALRKMQAGVSEAIVNRDTASELKTSLFDMFDDRYRDWQRVAHTEMNNAVQQGIYHEILDKSDGDQLVYKRPNPDACKHCKKVYLKSDGITPRIFKLSELAETNMGLKARDWKPTIGSVHPWCNCQIHVVPEGFDFIKRNVVVEPFEFKGRKYIKGEVVEKEFADLTEELKQKVGKNAILSFTGETAEPS